MTLEDPVNHQFFHSCDKEFIMYFLSMIDSVVDLENCKLISSSWNEILNDYSEIIYSERINRMIKQEPSLQGLRIILSCDQRSYKKGPNNCFNIYKTLVQFGNKWKVFCHSGYLPLLTGFDSFLMNFMNTNKNPYRTIAGLEKLNSKWESGKTTYFSFQTERDLEDSFRIHYTTWMSILKKIEWSVGLDPLLDNREITKGMSKFGGNADIPKNWSGQLSDFSLLLQINCNELNEILPRNSTVKIPSSGWIYLFGPGKKHGVYSYDKYLLKYFGGELNELNSYSLSDTKPCTPISFRLQVSLPDSLNIKNIPKTPLVFWYDRGECTFYYNCMKLNSNTRNYLFGYGNSDYVPKSATLFTRLLGEKFMFADADCLYVSCNLFRDGQLNYDTISAKISC